MFAMPLLVARLARRALVPVSIAALASPASAALITFSVGGSADPASIQGTVNDFRAALGDPDNGNAPGPLGSGRREINWDGGGAVVAAPAPPVFTGFQNIRGGTFSTPGSGFLQTPLNDPAFTGINPAYETAFSFFSPVRIFTPLGSNVTEATFSIPGTNGATPATVSGFGAVFSDVDLANTTSMQLFGASGGSLGTFYVEPGTVADGSLSFLGVFGDAGEQISRVLITTGNSALGPSDGSGIDVVVMDDFLYGEPVVAQQAVPAPASVLLMLAGLVAGAGMRLGSRGKLGSSAAA